MGSGSGDKVGRAEGAGGAKVVVEKAAPLVVLVDVRDGGKVEPCRVKDLGEPEGGLVGLSYAVPIAYDGEVVSVGGLNKQA